MAVFQSIEAKKWIVSQLQQGKQKKDIEVDFHVKFGPVDWLPNKNVKQAVYGFIAETQKEYEPNKPFKPHNNEWVRVLTKRAKQLWNSSVANKAEVGRVLHREYGKYRPTNALESFQKAARRALQGVPKSDATCEDVEEEKAEVQMDVDQETDEEEDQEQRVCLCKQCGVHADQNFWVVGCYANGCTETGHLGCMLPDRSDPERMYCAAHWLTKFTAAEPDAVKEPKLVTVVAAEKYFFCAAKKDLVYVKRETDPFTAAEKQEVARYRATIKTIHHQYRFEQLGDAELFPVDSTREVEVKRYGVNGVRVPFVVVDEWLSPEVQEIIVKYGESFFTEWREYRDLYPVAFQGGNDEEMVNPTGRVCPGNRTKVSCGKSYKTNQRSKVLQESDMSFEQMFEEEAEQTAIINLCEQLYRVADHVGVKEEHISWLLDEEVLRKEIPFLITTYNGTGLNSHIDLMFEGPVFVLTAQVKNTRQNAKNFNEKCISFGMVQAMIANIHACIPNKEGSLYFFYGWLTDWAYHGVPKMAGWQTIVLIIRHPRWLEIPHRLGI